jgi:hypothetical protein
MRLDKQPQQEPRGVPDMRPASHGRRELQQLHRTLRADATPRASHSRPARCDGDERMVRAHGSNRNKPLSASNQPRTARRHDLTYSGNRTCRRPAKCQLADMGCNAAPRQLSHRCTSMVSGDANFGWARISKIVGATTCNLQKFLLGHGVFIYRAAEGEL